MGKYEDNAAAVGKEADDEIVALDESISEARLIINTQQETLDRQAQQIAQLTAALADCQGQTPEPPQPEPSVQLIGSSTGKPIPGYAETDLSVIRVYLQPGDRPTSWSSDAQVKTATTNCKEAVWVSGKDAPDTWLDSFLASFASVGKDVIYTQNHEYGNDGTGDTFPSAAQIVEYKRRWGVVKSIALKYPYVKVVDIQLGSQGPTDWEKLYIPDLDGIGFDRYNPGIGTPKKYTPVAQVFDAVIAWAKLKGKPLYIGETGTGVVGTDNAGRVKWAGDARKYLLDNGCEVACWWNQALVVMDAPTAKAWLG